MEYDVFISHSSKDKTIADAICHALEENNIRCWIAPRDIPPGKAWASEIGKGIKNSQLVLLVYTKSANTSEAVSNEIDMAFSNKKIIIPFLIDNTPMNEEFNFYLNRKHWLVAYPDYKKKFAELINSICHILNKEEQLIITKRKTISTRSTIFITFAIIAVISILFLCIKFIILAPNIDLHNSLTETIIIDSVRIQEPDITQVLDTIQKSVINNPTSNKKDQDSGKTKEKVQALKVDETPQKKILIINGHSYSGYVNKDNKPDGFGILYYSKHCSIKIGYKEADVETGWRLEGNWENGEIVNGVLYDNNNNEKFKYK